MAWLVNKLSRRLGNAFFRAAYKASYDYYCRLDPSDEHLNFRVKKLHDEVRQLREEVNDIGAALRSEIMRIEIDPRYLGGEKRC